MHSYIGPMGYGLYSVRSFLLTLDYLIIESYIHVGTYYKMFIALNLITHMIYDHTKNNLIRDTYTD